MQKLWNVTGNLWKETGNFSSTGNYFRPCFNVSCKASDCKRAVNAAEVRISRRGCLFTSWLWPKHLAMKVDQSPNPVVVGCNKIDEQYDGWTPVDGEMPRCLVYESRCSYLPNRTCLLRRSQWSSGSVPDCSARGPWIESRCWQCLSYKQLWFTALGTGYVHLSCSAYRSTQPSTLRGTVNEYQLSGWVRATTQFNG